MPVIVIRQAASPPALHACLGGSVFCADLERARAIAERIESGMVFVTHPTASEPQLPFGGITRSGYAASCLTSARLNSRTAS
jgi:acyl-CoA reductase-like NAD-dependent aldehyde dehydrogenase